MNRDRLRTVLALRERVERRRLAERAAAVRELAGAERAHELASSARAQAIVAPGTSLVATELAAAHVGAIALGDVVDRAQAHLATTRRAADAANERLVSAAVDRKSVERLTERRAATRAREIAQRDARRLDEVALQVWRRSS